MKEVELFKWWLPPPAYKGPRAKPYLSSWHMTAEDAHKHGALRPDPQSRLVIQVAETEEEQAAMSQPFDAIDSESARARKAVRDRVLGKKE